MKKYLILIGTFFIYFSSFAQENVKRDSVFIISSNAAGIDTLKLSPPKEVNNFDLDSEALFKQLPPKTEIITIDKKVLLTLLKPFYNISIDSVKNDTLIDATFLPKFRLKINDITNDSIYIPLPKEKKPLYVERKYSIDTLKILSLFSAIVVDSLKKAADPIWWEHKNSIGLDITQAAFVNWNAGGENSIAGLLKLNLERTYKKLQTLWRNEVFIRYGLNKQRDRELRKTDDRIELNSTFGYRKDTTSNWYYSIKFNLRTQFTDGFSYPDVETPISRFFAPGYLFLGIGSQYNSKKNKFSIYLSPITLKSTFVFDDRLSDEGAFGVDPGKKTRHEFGAFSELKWDEPLFDNVLMSNRINFYSDYLNNFGNIDINWQLSFNLKVNKFLQANLGGHLIYDDDIKFKEDTNGDGILEITGARAQFKQVLAIGLLYNF